MDPACGSGNFLYVALWLLLDLEKAVINLAATLGEPISLPLVSPAQLHGIEINPYAYELAQTTIRIGYIQWLRDNGFGLPTEPILKPLTTFRQMDAIMAGVGDQGLGVRDQGLGIREPEWPAADVIIGNPPFLGDKKMRAELGDEYVDALRKLYEGRVRGGADLVVYWFEKARAMIELGKSRRAGLLATNSIRMGASRKVIENIKTTGDIFWAQSDRDWVLDGAAVNVSMIGFDSGAEQERFLDGKPVVSINSDLTSAVDVSRAVQLNENANLVFLGMMKGGPFEITSTDATTMLQAPVNPNGKPNSDVVKRRLGAQDITGRTSAGWVIDFVDMTEAEAAFFELPFEYVRRIVKPVRDNVRHPWMHTKWWLHGRSRPALRAAIKSLPRCIVTPEVAKHRLFVWMATSTIPDHTCHVVARDDDYFFGILHSHLHELWSLRIGSTLEDRPRYSSSRTFETFPFPWPPGQEPADDPRVEAIAQATRELVQLRDAWLNPPGTSDADLKKRTLTNLYNARPTWLDNAHRKLDAAVFAAYGWPADPSTTLRQAEDDSSGHDLPDEEILARLLALNLARAGGK